MLLVLALAGCTPGDGAPVRTEPVGLVDVDLQTGCVAAATALLRAELLQVAAGRGDRGGSVRAQLERLYAADPRVLERADRVNAELLTTAAADLLGPFRRQVEAEVEAYAPRVRAGCART